MASDLRLVPVQDLRALEALATPWARLHRRCADATPFQSPQWLIPWWRHVGEGALYTFAAYAGDELAAVLPLYIWERAQPRARFVLPLGAGTSDYLDVVCEPGSRGAVAEALRRQLERDRARFDGCEFAQLRPTSVLLEMALPDRWRDECNQAEPCPVLDLRAGRSVEECVPARMVQNLRYYRRRAERRSPLHFRHAQADSASAMFERLASLHGARWSTRNAPGVLASDAVRRAHRETIPALARAGMLRMYELVMGERVAAALYGLADAREGGSFHYYIGGYEPALADVSPGTLLIAHAIEQALVEGAGTFDFLRGREPYKYLWGARDRPTWTRRCHPD
ncbi:MAG TPA: GNAT family N-acetyltransferase [Casimicrobiaceae bacterium]|nr:GNAT family N-acetyltransferase [Casimicrobiaceae bacterium]